MKKGCFIKSIIFLTILVAVVTYIVQQKFDSWVLKPGRGIIKKVFDESWDKDMAHVRASAEKDSLRILIKDYIDRVSSGDLKNEKVEKIKDIIINASSDSIIDRNEFINLRNILRETNERSEKN
jgi:hypothetical protein